MPKTNVAQETPVDANPNTDGDLETTQTNDAEPTGISPEIAALVGPDDAAEAVLVAADQIRENEEAANAQKLLDDDLLAQKTRAAQEAADARAKAIAEAQAKAAAIIAERKAKLGLTDDASTTDQPKAKSAAMIAAEEAAKAAAEAARLAAEELAAIEQAEFEAETEAEWNEYRALREPVEMEETDVLQEIEDAQTRLAEIRERLAVIDLTNPRGNSVTTHANTSFGTTAIAGLVRKVDGTVVPMADTNGRFYTDFETSVTPTQVKLIQANPDSGISTDGSKAFVRAMGRDAHARIAANKGLKALLGTTYDSKANFWNEVHVYEIPRG